MDAGIKCLCPSGAGENAPELEMGKTNVSSNVQPIKPEEILGWRDGVFWFNLNFEDDG